jgi:toxin ParE1/3/4
MSFPEHPLVLSHQAQADYEDILGVTLRTWGEQQYDRYAALLDDALLALQDNPSLGHRSRQLPARYRLLHAGRHLIVYRFTEGTVYVIRILHDRMDVRQHIAEGEESLDDEEDSD